MNKGLFMVHTGNGKGKTTAALGLIFRAAGHGMSACLIQFLKGTWRYGELVSSERFRDLVDVHVMGKGFTWNSAEPDVHEAAALHAWRFAEETIREGKHGLVVLDELTYLLNYRLISVPEVIAALRQRPKEMHVLVTGRDAPQALVQAADLVTDMTEVRHHFRSGIGAQKGIEY